MKDLRNIFLSISIKNKQTNRHETTVTVYDREKKKTSFQVYVTQLFLAFPRCFELHTFFYKQRFFSTQPQSCFIFS